MALDIAQLLAFAVKNNASDLHLSAGAPPMIRVDGDMKRVNMPALTHKEVHSMVYDIMNDKQRKDYEEFFETDFSFEIPKLARFRVNAFNQNRGARVVILAVKPQLMATVATALAHALVHRPLVISVAAGIRTTDLARWLGDLALPLVRAMPNRPALVGAGASGLYADASLGGEARELAMTVLAGTGLCLWVENEAELDIVTALSGSGPAYFFRLAELMAQAAVAQGLAPEVARQLAAQTLAGAGRLVAAEARPDLARMRAEVTSPGGTTEAALKTFDAQGLPALVQAAQDAALRRSRELAAPAGNP
jgi:pyrroline-5-carboxylate reductase